MFSFIIYDRSWENVFAKCVILINKITSYGHIHCSHVGIIIKYLNEGSISARSARVAFEINLYLVFGQPIAFLSFV